MTDNTVHICVTLLPPKTIINRSLDSQKTNNNKKMRSRIVVVWVPLLVISLALLLMPSYSQVSDHRYAVIFDAGSTGSRVHVYCFDRNLNLVHIGKELELFVHTEPGLSSYASNPQSAANSLLSLLEKAESVIPKELLSETPVRVGATAGLRQLEGDTPDRILQAVRNLLRDKSALKSKPEWVTVLDGTQEGDYLWVTMNYLLGNLGKKYSNSVGVVDLGGGSAQMTYAISEEDAAKAPKLSNGESTYVTELFLKGAKYYLYAHSYLNYGLLAARAEILKAVNGSRNPCILGDYHGFYEYGGKSYEASAYPSGANIHGCRKAALKALNVNGSTCTHMKCTFGGIWNGGGGDGQKNLFVASFFYDKAAQAGFIDPNLPVAKARPIDFNNAAKRACSSKLEDAKSTYPRVLDLPYLCMDLVYQFTLLVEGFGLDPRQQITLVKQVKYGDALVEAAWPLGSAIEVMSSST